MQEKISVPLRFFHESPFEKINVGLKQCPIRVEKQIMGERKPILEKIYCVGGKNYE